MPAQNVAPYVADAVISVLRQTFEDFEFLVVDDASTDNTWQILQTLAAQDARIRLFRNERALGVPECMNFLALQVRGEYVARMDADDIAVPDRLALQVEALRSGDVDLCGGAFIEFPSNRLDILNGPVGDEEIKLSLLFESTIRQPTVMMRRDLLLREKYRTETIPTADYDLYVRLAPFVRFRNLPDVLLLWRVRQGQVTLRNEADNVRASNDARRMALQQLGISPTMRQLELQGQIWTKQKPACWRDVVETEEWLAFLASALDRLPAARGYFSGRWYRYCLKAAPYGPRTFLLFRKSPLHKLRPYSRGENIKLFVLSVLRIRYASRLYWLLIWPLPSQFRRRSRITRLGKQLLMALRG
jgi:glycosyltransferase involved in cell wall biosynthesis